MVNLFRLVNVGPLVEQQLDDLEMAVLGGQVKGSDSNLREQERAIAK